MVSVATEKLIPTLRERLSDMGVKGVRVRALFLGSCAGLYDESRGDHAVTIKSKRRKRVLLRNANSMS